MELRRPRALLFAAAALLAVVAVLVIASQAGGADIAPPSSQATAHHAPDEPTIALEPIRIAGDAARSVPAEAHDAGARTVENVSWPPPRSRPDLPTGRIRGRLVDAVGRPVGAMPIQALCMQDLDLERRTMTSGDGRFAFAELRIGHYRICVDEADLYGNRRATEDSSKRTRLLAGGDIDLGDLVVACDAAVEGCVVTADNQGIAGATVEIASMSTATVELMSKQGAKRSPVVTDALGRFHCGQLVPGRYRATVAMHEATAAHRELSTPRAVFFDLQPDAVFVLEPLVCGSGTARIHGTVVDENGKPVADLPVFCCDPDPATDRAHARGDTGPPLHRDQQDRRDEHCVLATARTDERGAYALLAVLPGPVAVHIGGSLQSDAGPGDNRLAGHGPVHSLVLAAHEDRDLGQTPVRTSHPYRLEGSVVVDPDWVKANGKPRLQLSIVNPGSSVLAHNTPILLAPDFMGDNHPALRTTTIALRADGTFSWWCEAAEERQRQPRELQVTRKGDKAKVTMPVTPRPDATDRVTLRFP